MLQNYIYEEGGMAYICQGTTCFPAIKTAHELNFELEKLSPNNCWQRRIVSNTVHQQYTSGHKCNK